MSFVKEKLEETRKKRRVLSPPARKTGLPVVSLVGYTSSGKTTLFSQLTSEHKQTSKNLFTTLSTTRAFQVNGNEALLTDTVGFINLLPTYMINEFKSTLEESLAAKLILLLIDASEDAQNIRIKYTPCWQALEELGGQVKALGYLYKVRYARF